MKGARSGKKREEKATCVLPEVVKYLVPEYVGAVLEVCLRNITIAADTDHEHRWRIDVN